MYVIIKSHNAAFINFIHLICCTCHVYDIANNCLSNLLRDLSALQQHLSPPQIWLSISCRVFDGYLLSMPESDTLFHSRTPLCVGNVSSLTEYNIEWNLSFVPRLGPAILLFIVSLWRLKCMSII